MWKVLLPRMGEEKQRKESTLESKTRGTVTERRGEIIREE